MNDYDQYCCEECFIDESLRTHLRKRGKKIEECSYCGAKEVYGLDPRSLKKMFQPLVNLYTGITQFYSTHDLKYGDHSESMLWHKLSMDWEIIDDSDVAENILKDMFEDEGVQGEYVEFLEDAVDIQDDWYGEDEGYHTTSKSWDCFCTEIKHVNRFFPHTFNKEIVELIAKANKKEVLVGKHLLRARINDSNEGLSKDKMGAPPPSDSKYGRMNPQGISYLYLSSDTETCVAEVRPNITDTVSVGRFILQQKLKLVDVIDPFIGSPFKYKNKLSQIYTAKSFLKSLGNTLMLPSDSRNSYLDYLPCQYICEFIKHLGYDGLIFRSTVSDGLNYILFSEHKVECVEVNQVNDIKLKYAFKEK